MGGGGRDRVCVYVCMCVSECACVRERESVCVCVCVSECACETGREGE